MAQESCAIDFKKAFYASIATAIPARPYTSATDFVAAGYTRILEPDGDIGSLWTWEYTKVPKRPAGTARATGYGFASRGLATVTMQSINGDDAAKKIAFPDMLHDGASLTGGGKPLYYRLILVTDINVYVAKKMSSSGNIGIQVINNAFEGTPYEFECYEDDDSDPGGTPNWFIEPLLS